MAGFIRGLVLLSVSGWVVKLIWFNIFNVFNVVYCITEAEH